ncbi:ankyrin repeat protein [Colletotrichum plurivorum]|uniref:Ankyrin repeat protein n=1 Tax=Colletotrichum plurivorum TaxID=2175906 RepID=A0A8H6NBP5_9PEZI|nr:ankyrin repeat protein [Colletotrichum plurivorum]
MASTPTQPFATDDMVIHPADDASNEVPHKPAAPCTADNGSLSKRGRSNVWAWRSLRERQKLPNELHHLSDPSGIKRGSCNEPAEDDKSWQMLQKHYPESVRSRVTGTTLVGDNESFISVAPSTVETGRPATGATSSSYDLSKPDSTPETSSRPGSARLLASRPETAEQRVNSSLSYRSRILSSFRSTKRASLTQGADNDDTMSTHSNDTVMLAQELLAINRVVEELEETYDTSKPTEFILPSSFLSLDLYCQKHKVCLKGITAHHRNKCICVDFMKSPERFWVSPSSISTEALKILNFSPMPGNEGLKQDCFGNTILHLIAARAKHHSMLIHALQTVGQGSECVTNAGGQTFMHVLREDWYSDSKSALLDLTQQLRSNRFPVQAQDVYGQTLAHLACRNIQDPVTLGKLLRLFDSNTLSKRDAFGLKPESLTLLRNEVDRNPLIYKAPVATDPGGPGGIEALWRLDDAVPQENASPVEIAAYEVRVLRFIHDTIKKPRKEDSQGRNGLHCLAVAIFARLRYLFSGILETSSFTRRHVWTAGTLNDQAATASRAQLVRNALSQAATYLSLLISAGVDFDSYNALGNTVLMDFVAFLPQEAGNLQSKEILQALTDAGVRLEARNRQGETALLVAARLCRRTALKVLIDAGARIEARDADGRDAVTIIKDCLATTNQDSVSTINYEGCLKELLSSCDGFIPVPTATSEWCLPHRESTELQVRDSLEGKTSLSLLDQLVLPGPRGEAGFLLLEDGTSGNKPFEALPDLHIEGGGVSGSPGASIANEETHCGRKMRPISTDSLSADLNSLAEDMCDLVLSRAFGVSMDDVARPQDVWASIRRCLGELSAVTSEPTGIANCPATPEPGDQEMQDNEAPQPNASNAAFPALQPSTSLRKRPLHSEGRNDDDPDDCGSNSNGNDRGRDRNWDSSTGQDTKRSKGERPNRANQHFACSRCHEKFGTLRDRDAHLRVSPDKICSIRDVVDNPVIDDPEDGITTEIAERLRDRRAKVSVTNWAALWYALFPEDEEIKSDEFDPIIEADEVKKAFERNAGRCASALQRVSSSMVLEAASMTHQELGNTLWELFQSFIDHTLQACRDMLIPSPVYAARGELTSGRVKTPLQLDSASAFNDQTTDHTFVNSLLGLRADSVSDLVAPDPDHRRRESILDKQLSLADSVLFPTRDPFGYEILPPSGDISDHQIALESAPTLGDQNPSSFIGHLPSSVILSVSGNQLELGRRHNDSDIGLVMGWITYNVFWKNI